MILAALVVWAQTRIASDFEIQQMEKQIAQSRDFVSQLSGRLNLGDLRASRNESSLARIEYAKALTVASNERLSGRKASDLTRYATATSYAALAQAKLANDATAFAMAEESLRYESGSGKTWNLYASTMSLLRRPLKAVSAARNAVAIEERGGNALDLAIYRYSLASALIDVDQTREAESLLTDVIAALRSNTFATLRQDVQQHEAFEIYSSARGEEAAYISILNRAQLRLARLYEARGDVTHAREQYQNVLNARNDEPTALAAMARLAASDEDRARYFSDAFDANPFSLPLIRDYQRYLTAGDRRPATGDRGTGGQVRLALEQMHRGDFTAARTTLDALAKKFPQNDTIALLQRELTQRRASGPIVLKENPTASELRAILDAFQDNRLTPDERSRLDRMSFTSTAILYGATGSVFETGTIEGVTFRFPQPTQFQGTFPAQTVLRLTYRILGPTRSGDADALLIEPVRIEVPR